MSKLKMVVVMLIVFFVGVGVGSAGKSSTTNSQDIKSSSTKTEEQAQEPQATEEAQLKGKVEVKSHKSSLSSGYTKVVGEVVNNTEAPVTYVKVTATFYDKDDQVIGTGFSYAGDTTDTPLEPTLTTPFEVSSFPDQINPDHYKLDVTWN